MIWIVVILCVLAVVWQWKILRDFAQNRKTVIKCLAENIPRDVQTDTQKTVEKWYAIAAAEVHTTEGNNFLKTNFKELFSPELIRYEDGGLPELPPWRFPTLFNLRVHWRHSRLKNIKKSKRTQS